MLQVFHVCSHTMSHLQVDPAKNRVGACLILSWLVHRHVVQEFSSSWWWIYRAADFDFGVVVLDWTEFPLGRLVHWRLRMYHLWLKILTFLKLYEAPVFFHEAPGIFHEPPPCCQSRLSWWSWWHSQRVACRSLNVLIDALKTHWCIEHILRLLSSWLLRMVVHDKAPRNIINTPDRAQTAGRLVRLRYMYASTLDSLYAMQASCVGLIHTDTWSSWLSCATESKWRVHMRVDTHRLDGTSVASLKRVLDWLYNCLLSVVCITNLRRMSSKNLRCSPHFDSMLQERFGV